MGPEGPDYMAVGDLSTLQDIPWMPGYAAHSFATAWSTRSLMPTARGSRCKRKSRGSPSRGLTLDTGIEPEFMLLARRADGSLGPADASDDLDKPCYDYKGLYRSREVLDDMVAGLARGGHRCVPNRS